MAWLRTFTRIAAAFLLLGWAGGLAAAEQQRVNVNTADAATIASTLSGVGLKKAEAIVAYREANGRFNAAADLIKVKGIGPAIVDKNADRIVISETDGATGARRTGESATKAGGDR